MKKGFKLKIKIRVRFMTSGRMTNYCKKFVKIKERATGMGNLSFAQRMFGMITGSKFIF